MQDMKMTDQIAGREYGGPSKPRWAKMQDTKMQDVQMQDILLLLIYYYRKKRFRWRNVKRLQGHLTNAKDSDKTRVRRKVRTEYLSDAIVGRDIQLQDMKIQILRGENTRC